MKKEFVPYELAVKLKKLGFDVPCLLSWNLYTHEVNFNGQPSKFASEDVIQLPTFSQAFRWFREKYELMSEIIWMSALPTHNTFSARIKSSEKTESMSECNTYEEAELACLDKLIEIVESKSE